MTDKRPILTEEEVNRVKSINSLLKPENWNKQMYDAFMLGYNLARFEFEKKGEK